MVSSSCNSSKSSTPLPEVVKQSEKVNEKEEECLENSQQGLNIEHDSSSMQGTFKTDNFPSSSNDESKTTDAKISNIKLDNTHSNETKEKHLELMNQIKEKTKHKKEEKLLYTKEQDNENKNEEVCAEHQDKVEELREKLMKKKLHRDAIKKSSPDGSTDGLNRTVDGDETFTADIFALEDNALKKTENESNKATTPWNTEIETPKKTQMKQHQKKKKVAGVV